jgi:hypothetical protein
MLDEELRESKELAKANKSIPNSVRQSLDPRDRLLQDLKHLIIEPQSKGFCPILFMDPNEDWSKKTG